MAANWHLTLYILYRQQVDYDVAYYHQISIGHLAIS